MATRYNSNKIMTNDIDYYAPLRRGASSLDHYGTPRMRNPRRSQRRNAQTVRHVWTYGDRLYKLAELYYADVRYWWIIAHWNGLPTESHFRPGVIITIPTNLEQALVILRS